MVEPQAVVPDLDQEQQQGQAFALFRKLRDIVSRLSLDSKGIHAADESGGSMKKKLEELGVKDTPENRIAFRGALMSIPGYAETVGGTILFDETLRQSYEGEGVADLLKRQGAVIGIKVDAGLESFDGSDIEQVGKDNQDELPARLKEYAEIGAEFAKFRVVANIGTDCNGKTCPTDACLRANAVLLAMYAKKCQEAGIVPIVEPEVNMNAAHDIEACRDASSRFLAETFKALEELEVFLPGVILKTNMVLPGKLCPQQESDSTIAQMTVDTLAEHCPKDLGGIVFLSGGQTSEDAMNRLAAIRQNISVSGEDRFPPHLVPSSSFSRALQNPALEAFAAAVKADEPADEIKRVTQEAFGKSLAENKQALMS